jgi:hypothetical protein
MKQEATREKNLPSLFILSDLRRSEGTCDDLKTETNSKDSNSRVFILSKVAVQGSARTIRRINELFLTHMHLDEKSSEL